MCGYIQTNTHSIAKSWLAPVRNKRDQISEWDKQQQSQRQQQKLHGRHGVFHEAYSTVGWYHTRPPIVLNYGEGWVAPSSSATNLHLYLVLTTSILEYQEKQRQARFQKKKVPSLHQSNGSWKLRSSTFHRETLQHPGKCNPAFAYCCNLFGILGRLRNNT